MNLTRKILIPISSSGSEISEGIEIYNSQNQNVFVARSSLKWKECASGNATGKLATQNILLENMGKTNFSKRNLNNDNVLDVWLLFIETEEF
ncbi:hypothetical protein NPIL_514711 [Nephila pilipes]|uniref:Uncharacterized protein n=1 Tax=Nephila pilipes TaxID=299642 RepID=A0A8X6PUG7_NEPPI|nr:hypothetical protein NPIL_514711 [Nephila pilipes]